LIVAPSKEGFSSSIHFQNAFSAKVLLAKFNLAGAFQSWNDELTSVFVTWGCISTLLFTFFNGDWVPVRLSESYRRFGRGVHDGGNGTNRCD
jgi:hypothetical protein